MNEKIKLKFGTYWIEVFMGHRRQSIWLNSVVLISVYQLALDKALTSSICWMPWCNYSHGGPFQAPCDTMLNRESGRDVYNWFSGVAAKGSCTPLPEGRMDVRVSCSGVGCRLERWIWWSSGEWWSGERQDGPRSWLRVKWREQGYNLRQHQYLCSMWKRILFGGEGSRKTWKRKSVEPGW